MWMGVKWRVNSVVVKSYWNTTRQNVSWVKPKDVLHVIFATCHMLHALAHTKKKAHFNVPMFRGIHHHSPFGTFQKLSGPLDQLLKFSHSTPSSLPPSLPRSLMANGDVIWSLLLVTYSGNFLTQQLWSLSGAWALCCRRCALLPS